MSRTKINSIDELDGLFDDIGGNEEFDGVELLKNIRRVHDVYDSSEEKTTQLPNEKRSNQ